MNSLDKFWPKSWLLIKENVKLARAPEISNNLRFQATNQNLIELHTHLLLHVRLEQVSVAAHDFFLIASTKMIIAVSFFFRI